METLQINQIGQPRQAILEGREYIVVPMTTIVPGVLNGSKGALYYPPEEIARSADQWNHMPIVVYHPTDPLTNSPLSARDPGVLDRQGIGFLKESEVAAHNGKLRHEGWFDVERTKEVDPRVYQSLKSGHQIELSTGLFTENTPAEPGANHNGRAYTHIAKNYRPDHLAILPDQRGACSIQDGCGVLVNKEQVVSTQTELVTNLVSMDDEIPQEVIAQVGNAGNPNHAADGKFTSAEGSASAPQEKKAPHPWAVAADRAAGAKSDEIKYHPGTKLEDFTIDSPGLTSADKQARFDRMYLDKAAEGATARAAGIPETDTPYPLNTVQHIAWMLGHRTNGHSAGRIMDRAAHLQATGDTYDHYKGIYNAWSQGETTPTENFWSPEARQAAIEARKNKTANPTQTALAASETARLASAGAKNKQLIGVARDAHLTAAQAHQDAHEVAKKAGDKKSARAHQSEVQRHQDNASILDYNTKGFLRRLQSDLTSNEEENAAVIENAWSDAAREAAIAKRKWRMGDGQEVPAEKRNHSASDLLDIGHMSGQQLHKSKEVKDYLDSHGIKATRPVFSDDHAKVQDAQGVMKQLAASGHEHLGYTEDRDAGSREELFRGHGHDIGVVHDGTGHGMVGVKGKVRITKQGTPILSVAAQRARQGIHNMAIEDMTLTELLTTNAWSDAARAAAAEARKAGGHVHETFANTMGATFSAIDASKAADIASHGDQSALSKRFHTHGVTKLRLGTNEAREAHLEAMKLHREAMKLHTKAAGAAKKNEFDDLAHAHRDMAKAHETAMDAHYDDSASPGGRWAALGRLLNPSGAKKKAPAAPSTPTPTSEVEEPNNDAEKAGVSDEKMAKIARLLTKSGVKNSSTCSCGGVVNSAGVCPSCGKKMVVANDEEDVSTMNREQLLGKLTANCSCDKEKSALNSLSDEVLKTVYAAHVVAQNAGASAAVEEDDDEDDDSEVANAMPPWITKKIAERKAAKEKKPEVDSDLEEEEEIDAQQQETVMNWSDLIAKAPPEVQAAVQNATQITQREQARLATLLVNANPNLAVETKKHLFDKWSKLSLPELQERVSAMPLSHNLRSDFRVEDQPIFLGANSPGGQAQTFNRGVDQQADLLIVPTINWAEEAALAANAKK